MRRTWAFLLLVGLVTAFGPMAEGSVPRAPGKHQWTRQFGTSTSDTGAGMAVDASGAYVAGYTAAALPRQTHRGDLDAFVRAYDHNGKHRWTRQFGSGARDESSGVAVDASGVYVVGTTWAALPGKTHQGAEDVFVRAYTLDGKHRWTRQFGTAGGDFGLGVAADASAVYVVGTTGAALPGQTHRGATDAFVRAYTHAGKLLWTRQFGTGGEDTGWGVAVDASGVYVAGQVGGALAGQTLQGGGDVFVRAYDHNGKQRWTRQFGTVGIDRGAGVAASARGVYVTGRVAGALPGQTHYGSHDAFVRKYDHAGEHRWTRQFGTDAWDMGMGVTVNSSGVYVVGQTTAALPGQTHQGKGDAFLRALDHAGGRLWTRQFGTGDNDMGEGVAADASGVYVAGTVNGALPGKAHLGGLDAFVRKYTTE